MGGQGPISVFFHRLFTRKALGAFIWARTAGALDEPGGCSDILFLSKRAPNKSYHSHTTPSTYSTSTFDGAMRGWECTYEKHAGEMLSMPAFGRQVGAQKR